MFLFLSLFSCSVKLSYSWLDIVFRAAWAVIYMAIITVLSVIAVTIMASLDFFKTPSAFAFYFVAIMVYGATNILLGFSWSTLFNKNDYAFIVFMGTIALSAGGKWSCPTVTTLPPPCNYMLVVLHTPLRL